ncbi:MAG TPA: hypothetical protein PLG43_10155 [Spirochaetia bacterium]|nr:hypothetical protein [Spirochaetia bacterium]
MSAVIHGFRMEPEVKKQVKGNDVFFTIVWSSFMKADKFIINASVPAMAGIFELYYLDEKKKLNLISMQRVWYGGLRSRLRMVTDPELVEDPKRKQLLSTHTCYFRYSLINSSEDMADIMFFFASNRPVAAGCAKPSGRYTTVFVKELSQDKLVTI